MWALPHDLSAAAIARHRIEEWLAGSGVLESGVINEELVDDATLIASELAVNAVRHGQAPAVLTAHVDGQTIRISVTGRSPHGDPALGQAALTSTSGRGLALVAALSQEWGWSREGDELTVWALLRRPTTSAGRREDGPAGSP